MAGIGLWILVAHITKKMKASEDEVTQEVAVIPWYTGMVICALLAGKGFYQLLTPEYHALTMILN